MAITVNLCYTGRNGNALRFVEEMTNSGTAAAIRAEAGNELNMSNFRNVIHSNNEQ